MQIDMHYWAVLYLAIKAGIPIGVARVIAHASQFVDDQARTAIIPAKSGSIAPVMTSHKPIDYRLATTRNTFEVWPIFHFMPGNLNAKNFMTRMRCVKNGPLVKLMLQHALQHKTKPFGPHLVGIAAHILFDSFAHDGFIGLSTGLNKIKNSSLKFRAESQVKKHILRKFERFMRKIVTNAKNIVIGTVAETIPIGHGAVYILPDLPFVKFSYKTEDNRQVNRNNVEYFLEACRYLYNFLIEFAKNKPFWKRLDNPASWDSISDEIKKLLQKEGDIEKRVENWKGIISSSRLYPANSAIYSLKAWSPAKAPSQLAQGITLENCHPLLFNDAAQLHQRYAFEIMREHGLIISATNSFKP